MNENYEALLNNHSDLLSLKEIKAIKDRIKYYSLNLEHYEKRDSSQKSLSINNS